MLKLTHPHFLKSPVPEEKALGPFRLRKLTVSDLDEDYAAVMESRESLLTIAESDGWPDGLTVEEDRIDLAWHQREFDLQRSFAWVITDAGSGAYLGCAYVMPAWGAEEDWDVWYWFRSSVAGDVDQAGFEARYTGWIDGPDWPDMTYRVRKPAAAGG